MKPGDISGKTERGPVKLNLLLPTDLIGDLFPGSSNIISTLLGRILSCKDFLQFIFSNAVILEDPGDPGFNGSVGMIVGIRF